MLVQRLEERADAGGAAELGDGERVGLEVAVGGAQALLDVGDLAVELGEPDGQEVAGQRLVVVRAASTSSTSWPELGQQRRGPSTAATASRSGWALMAEEAEYPIAQRAGRVDGSPRRTGSGRQGARTPRSGSGADDRVEQAGAVAHGARHDTLGDHAEHRLAGLGAVRREAAASFRPTRPLQAAGMRTEPPPSLAPAAGTMPAADRRAGAAGRAARGVVEVPRVAGGAHSSSSVMPLAPNSGVLVLPKMTSPASRKRCVTRACSVGDVVLQGARAARWSGSPRTPGRGP